jgi:hypothetical protein
MVICSVCDELLAVLLKRFSESLGIGNYLLGVGLKLRSGNFLELYSDSSNVGVVWTSLELRKDSEVNGFFIFLSVEDQS